MSDQPNNLARVCVLIDVVTGEIRLDRDTESRSRTPQEGFEALEQCLIPMRIRGELLTKSKAVDGPYLVSLREEDIRLNYAYNKDYKGVQTCVCGHDYYRHFDTYENMSTVGCKYCPCFIFEAAEDDREIEELIKDDSWLLPKLEQAILEDNLESIVSAELRALMMWGHKMWDSSKDERVWHHVLAHEWHMMKEMHGVKQTAKMMAETLQMGRPDDCEETV